MLRVVGSLSYACLLGVLGLCRKGLRRCKNASARRAESWLKFDGKPHAYGGLVGLPQHLWDGLGSWMANTAVLRFACTCWRTLQLSQ